MKEREYKNFVYVLSSKNDNAIYYGCKEKCGGTMKYTKGLSIVELQKHACVDTGKVIDLMAVCNIHY